MRLLILACCIWAALCLVAAHEARAGCDFSNTDYWMLGGTSALIFVDWAQTRKVLSQTDADGDPKYSEGNPFLGSHPSSAELNQRVAIGLGLVWAVTCWLPHQDRPWFLGGVIGIETYAIASNYRVTGTWGF